MHILKYLGLSVGCNAENVSYKLLFFAALVVSFLSVQVIISFTTEILYYCLKEQTTVVGHC